MNFIGKFKDKIAHYINARLDLIKLDFIQRTSGILSYLIFTFICLLFTLCLFIFVGLGLGEYFSALVDSRAGGYFITAGIYLLLFLIMILFRAAIFRIFSGIFIRALTDDDDEHDMDQQQANKTSE